MSVVMRRRLRAARHLGGFANAQALARAIGRRGYSERQLREWEQGKLEPETHKLAVIADACGVPACFFDHGFFESDFSVDDRVAVLTVERDYFKAQAEGALEVARLALERTADPHPSELAKEGQGA